MDQLSAIEPFIRFFIALGSLGGLIWVVLKFIFEPRIKELVNKSIVQLCESRDKEVVRKLIQEQLVHHDKAQVETNGRVKELEQRMNRVENSVAMFSEALKTAIENISKTIGDGISRISDQLDNVAEEVKEQGKAIARIEGEQSRAYSEHEHPRRRRGD